MNFQPAHSRAARALLNWTQQETATRMGVGLSTLRDFETERRGLPAETIAKIIAVYEDAGIKFQNGGKPGARLDRR